MPDFIISSYISNHPCFVVILVKPMLNSWFCCSVLYCLDGEVIVSKQRHVNERASNMTVFPL